MFTSNKHITAYIYSAWSTRQKKKTIDLSMIISVGNLVQRLSLRAFSYTAILQWRSQPDFLLLLCKFQLLAIIIS